MICQHWLKLWLVAIRQQAIAWTNVDLDLCCHVSSLGHNELIWLGGRLHTNMFSMQMSFTIMTVSWSRVNGGDFLSNLCLTLTGNKVQDKRPPLELRRWRTAWRSRVQKKLLKLWGLTKIIFKASKFKFLLDPSKWSQKNGCHDGNHFSGTILKYISFKENLVFWLKFHWCVFLGVKLVVT